MPCLYGVKSGGGAWVSSCDAGGGPPTKVVDRYAADLCRMGILRRRIYLTRRRLLGAQDRWMIRILAFFPRLQLRY